MSILIENCIHRQLWTADERRSPEQMLSREWLVTNGLGGYASGTISGVSTRRYHGMLIASLPAPIGRAVMFNHLFEEVVLPDGTIFSIGGEHPAVPLHASHPAALSNFSLECGLPVWFYEFGEYLLERRVFMPYRSNTIHLMYRMISGPSGLHVRLRPSLHFRPHEGSVAEPLTQPYQVVASGPRIEIRGDDYPSLKLIMQNHPGALVLDGGRMQEVHYELEKNRGYDHRGTLWSPGYFRAELSGGEEVTLSASTEEWDVFLANAPSASLSAEFERRQRLVGLVPERSQEGFPAELVLAADQFLITPTTRAADAARARAVGDEIRSVIAGYHWFTDWGRDTMISLEGLTLTTGRYHEARYILNTFAFYVSDGLIPNLFPEGERTGLYHTADATLWYFHAIDRYVTTTGDRTLLKHLLPTLRDIIEHHIRGTHFGIGVDAKDGLLTQGAEGYQLTWMDAKVDGWVVTPRRGKAVEINALWYNALRLTADWLASFDEAEESQRLFEMAERTRESFNGRFWCAEQNYLYDVVDGEGPDSTLLRPNQLLAISLSNPVLNRQHWSAVVEACTQRLLTPMGLRSLAPGQEGYQPYYDGDLRTRDAAYHQGTVWAWLIGPFIDAWMKTHPQRIAEARSFLEGFRAHLSEDCVGSISEIFDAEAPYHPRGCIAQAWSVAEVLRCLVKTGQAAADFDRVS